MNHYRYPCLKAGRMGGFTLIELMIVVAIVGILAAVAYPSYRHSVLKGRRSDATIALTKLAQRLERCNTQFGRFSDPGCSVQDGDASQSDNGYYDLRVAVNGSDNSYALSATPNAKGGQNEDGCTQYQLFSNGKRTAAKTDIADAEEAQKACW